MQRFNRNAHFLSDDGGHLGFREDVTDPDGRMYQLGYISTRDGTRAVAYCLFNPWGGEGRPNAGVGYATAHCAGSGFLCLGETAVTNVESSPYSLDFVIQRARFWCTAFSVYMEQGEFPNP